VDRFQIIKFLGSGTGHSSGGAEMIESLKKCKQNLFRNILADNHATLTTTINKNHTK
jgi:hypothetical protein